MTDLALSGYLVAKDVGRWDTRDIALAVSLLKKVRAQLLRVEAAALDDVDKALLATLESVLLDPELAHARYRLRAGELALSIEGDEVTWIDTDQTADAIAQALLQPSGRTR